MHTFFIFIFILILTEQDPHPAEGSRGFPAPAVRMDYGNGRLDSKRKLRKR